ncbi:MAG TPA: class I SAM-dependent methyltransferase [Methylophilaceae bacterium]|nr:class I SAM-dependent methyltransferase [Methylophilaceae bacterium]
MLIPMNLHEKNQPYCGIDNLNAMVAAHNYNRFIIRQLLREAGDSIAIVDFGAGAGLFSEAMKARGYFVTCVEPDPILRESLVDRGFRCVSSIEELSECGYDFLFTINVLEHIRDDERALQQILRVTKPGRRAYIYVPSFKVLFSSMDARVGHFRRYRLSDLTQKLENAGFTEISGCYTDFIGAIMTLVFKLIGSRNGNVNITLLKIYDRLLFPANIIFDWIFHNLFGKNLIVSATRPTDLCLCRKSLVSGPTDSVTR